MRVVDISDITVSNNSFLLDGEYLRPCFVAQILTRLFDNIYGNMPMYLICIMRHLMYCRRKRVIKLYLLADC